MKKKILYSVLLLVVSALIVLNYSSTNAEGSDTKIAIKSATHGTPQGGTMNIANTYDGNLSTTANVMWNPIGGPQAFYTYDLGDIYDISRIHLNFFTTRAHFYKIQVSNNGVNFTTAYELLSGAYATTNVDGTNYYIQDLNISTQARYIKIIAYATALQAYNGTSGAWYQIAEVAFYGNMATEILPLPVNNQLAIVGATSGTPSSGTMTITKTYDGNPTTIVDVCWTPIGGPEAFYTYDLGKICNIRRVHLNFHISRAVFYKLQVSNDGVNFVTAYENLSNAYDTTTVNGVAYYIQEFDLTDVKGRYIKVIPYGTTKIPYDGISGEWARLADVAFYGDLYQEVNYKGSQIRSTLVPTKTGDDTFNADEMRQGLRFCFELEDIGNTIMINGEEYTVTAQGALVMLKTRLDAIGKEYMTVENVGKTEKLLNQTNLTDWTEEDKIYKCAYIYNIPKGQKDSLICVRAYIECKRVSDQKTEYIYSPILTDSITSVYERIPADMLDRLDSAVQNWFVVE